MLKTTKAARASQKPAMMATTQPTTSFWFAAKRTATMNAVTRTIRPGPLMRNIEKPPLAGLEDDGELPKVRMQPLSQMAGSAPAVFHPGRTARPQGLTSGAGLRSAELQGVGGTPFRP